MTGSSSQLGFELRLELRLELIGVQNNSIQLDRSSKYFNKVQCSSIQVNAISKIIEYAYVLDSASSTMKLQNSIQLNAAQCNSIQLDADEHSSIHLNTAQCNFKNH